MCIAKVTKLIKTKRLASSSSFFFLLRFLAGVASYVINLLCPPLQLLLFVRIPPPLDPSKILPLKVCASLPLPYMKSIPQPRPPSKTMTSKPVPPHSFLFLSFYMIHAPAPFSSPFPPEYTNLDQSMDGWMDHPVLL